MDFFKNIDFMTKKERAEHEKNRKKFIEKKSCHIYFKVYEFAGERVEITTKVYRNRCGYRAICKLWGKIHGVDFLIYEDGIICGDESWIKDKILRVLKWRGVDNFGWINEKSDVRGFGDNVECTLSRHF